MFRIIKVQKLKSIVIVVHTVKDALLIVCTTKLTPSFVEKCYTIFICLVYEVLHYFYVLNCDLCESSYNDR
jgi:hypothetical protein